MSKKDFDIYYQQICEQRQLMMDELHDFEIEAQNNLIEPERLDKIKETIQPLINNYQTLSWVKFLLDKPVKKNKCVKFEKQMSSKLENINKEFTGEGIKNQNNKCIDNLEKVIKK